MSTTRISLLPIEGTDAREVRRYQCGATDPHGGGGQVLSDRGPPKKGVVNTIIPLIWCLERQFWLHRDHR